MRASGVVTMSTWRAPRPSKSSAVATLAEESSAKIGKPRLQLAVRSREGDVEARPALAGNRRQRRAGLGIELGVEQILEAVAAEPVLLLDDQ